MIIGTRSVCAARLRIVMFFIFVLCSHEMKTGWTPGILSTLGRCVMGYVVGKVGTTCLLYGAAFLWQKLRGKKDAKVIPNTNLVNTQPQENSVVTYFTKEKILAMRTHLNQKIIGQEKAVDVLYADCVLHRAKLCRATHAALLEQPIVFELVGPPSSGRTTFAKAVASYFFGEDHVMHIQSGEVDRSVLEKQWKKGCGVVLVDMMDNQKTLSMVKALLSHCKTTQRSVGLPMANFIFMLKMNSENGKDSVSGITQLLHGALEQGARVEYSMSDESASCAGFAKDKEECFDPIGRFGNRVLMEPLSHKDLKEIVRKKVNHFKQKYGKNIKIHDSVYSLLTGSETATTLSSRAITHNIKYKLKFAFEEYYLYRGIKDDLVANVEHGAIRVRESMDQLKKNFCEHHHWERMRKSIEEKISVEKRRQLIDLC
jgi:hypothetical protein